jgi:protein required for attachment to host cells
MTTWIVVADRSRARILAAESPEANKLEEVVEFVHPASRLSRQDVVSDAPGRFEAVAGGRHTGEPETDFKHETAEEFAHEIIAYLDKARLENAFDRVGLVSAPLFLGVLRDKMPRPMAHMVAWEVDRDYTQLKTNEIRKHLPELL